MDLHVLMRCLNETAFCFRLQQANLVFRITLKSHLTECKYVVVLLKEKKLYDCFKWDRHVRLCNLLGCPLLISVLWFRQTLKSTDCWLFLYCYFVFVISSCYRFQKQQCYLIFVIRVDWSNIKHWLCKWFLLCSMPNMFASLRLRCISDFKWYTPIFCLQILVWEFFSALDRLYFWIMITVPLHSTKVK